MDRAGRTGMAELTQGERKEESDSGKQGYPPWFHCGWVCRADSLLEARGGELRGGRRELVQRLTFHALTLPTSERGPTSVSPLTNQICTSSFLGEYGGVLEGHQRWVCHGAKGRHPPHQNESGSDSCCNSDQSKICAEHRGEGRSFQLGGEKSFMEGLPLTLALKVREDFNRQRWGLVGRAGSAGECAGAGMKGTIQPHRRGLVCFEQRVQWMRLELEKTSLKK